jgi:3-methyladenine DNA glycosylase AlkD
MHSIRQALFQHQTWDPERAKRFFKTAPGSYGEHDRFIGVSVPVLRKLASVFTEVPKAVLSKSLSSPFNEERFLALLILQKQYEKGNSITRDKVYHFYKDHLAWVNNWNLVDLSAPSILGAYVWDKDRFILDRLSHSERLWDRRIAMVATLYFIRKNDLEWTFKIALSLQKDTHDLIHKAVGWMLREAGKRNQEVLTQFLLQHASHMPKTMLRYATEAFAHKDAFYFPQKELMNLKECGTVPEQSAERNTS